jgi:hypothetical protein
MKALLEAGADPDARVKGHPWFMVYSDCGNGNCGLSNVTGSTPSGARRTARTSKR